MADLGQNATEAAGQGETVYLAEDITAHSDDYPAKPMFSFAYYVDAEMNIVSVERVNTDNYAIEN